MNAWLPVISMSPTFTFGPSLTLKVTFERGGRDLLDLRIDGGVLAAALGQEFLQDDGGALDLVRDRTAIPRERPTLRSLKRSRISETVTDLMPS